MLSHKFHFRGLFGVLESVYNFYGRSNYVFSSNSIRMPMIAMFMIPASSHHISEKFLSLPPVSCNTC